MLLRFRTLVLATCLVLGVSGCGHTFDVEGRQTRVNVWLTAPALAERGESLEALIYVGPYKVVDGPVEFPAGINTVILPPVYLRQGSHKVSVVLAGGTFTSDRSIGVTRESWLDITLRNRVLNIGYVEGEPSRIGR